MLMPIFKCNPIILKIKLKHILSMHIKIKKEVRTSNLVPKLQIIGKDTKSSPNNHSMEL